MTTKNIISMPLKIVLPVVLLLVSVELKSDSEVLVYGKVQTLENQGVPRAIITFVSQADGKTDSTYSDENGEYSIYLNIGESGIDDEKPIPGNFKLYQNYPNPFNPGTWIPFELPKPAKVKIKIYNILGQKINTIVDEDFPEGKSEIYWTGIDENGKSISAGIYFYRLEAAGVAKTGKMLLLDGGCGKTTGNAAQLFFQKPLCKSADTLMQKTYTICGEKEGFFPTVEDDFIVTSEDMTIEKNIVLENCRLDSLALFASIDGNPKGLWIFDANTFEKIDSLEMDWVPFSLEFSNDYSTWYSRMSTIGIFAIDAKTKEIIRQTSSRNTSLILDRQKKYIITYYGSDYIQFYDAQTFELFYEDSVGEIYGRMVTSPTEDKIYAFHISGQGTGIMVYNTHDYQIEQVIRLTDDEQRSRGMQPADLDVSPDGNYLFATVYNWSDPNAPGWYGSFYAIDLTTNQVIAEHLCGAFSQMGVSPDGRYVYVSDPAGYLYELFPTEHVLRYDINSNEMEIFVNGSSDIGLLGKGLITDQIVIAPDNRTMFITIWGGAKATNGKYIHMAKIDTYTKKILGYYCIPPDHRGYITSLIRGLKLSKYPP